MIAGEQAGRGGLASSLDAIDLLSSVTRWVCLKMPKMYVAQPMFCLS
jgi:hypothetical protein